MLEPRRQELLKILGVDQYRRRSVVRQVAVEETPVEEKPLPEISQADTVAEPTPVFEPEPKAPEEKIEADKPAQKPMRLLWWQHEDLLFIEEFSAEAQLPDLARLAQNIAAALGRSPGLDGELNWPPAGDFNAISKTDFLKHFVRGRSESTEELKLLLTSDLLVECATELGNTYQIQSLSAMLADPSLKPQTWQILKDLRLN